MRSLNSDELFLISEYLNVKDLRNFFMVNSKTKRLYHKDSFWINKIEKEFPDYVEHFKDKSSRDKYILLYALQKIKTVFEWKVSLTYIHEMVSISLFKKQEIIKEIGLLKSLEFLNINNDTPNICHNLKLYKIPDFISSLDNLVVLNLSCNKLTDMDLDF